MMGHPVSEQAPPEGSDPRPIPDLGFFAGPPTRGSSTFGGARPTPPIGPPATGQFGAAPVNQFGTAPASTFGTPSALVPSYGAGPAGPPARSASSTLKVVALVVGLVLIAGSVTAGRFGWHHFVADPVLPDTLQGMPRLIDPSSETVMRAAQDDVGKNLTAGSKAKVALYSSSQGLGYMLFALRGSSKPQKSNDDLKDAATTTYGDVVCYAMPTEAGTAFAATMCMRSFYRRTVVVLAFGVTAPDPVTVAAVTDEAWQAQ